MILDKKKCVAWLLGDTATLVLPCPSSICNSNQLATPAKKWNIGPTAIPKYGAAEGDPQLCPNMPLHNGNWKPGGAFPKVLSNPTIVFTCGPAFYRRFHPEIAAHLLPPL